jgi:hypothetical protein
MTQYYDFIFCFPAMTYATHSTPPQPEQRALARAMFARMLGTLLETVSGDLLPGLLRRNGCIVVDNRECHVMRRDLNGHVSVCPARRAYKDPVSIAQMPPAGPFPSLFHLRTQTSLHSRIYWHVSVPVNASVIARTVAPHGGNLGTVSHPG